MIDLAVREPLGEAAEASVTILVHGAMDRAASFEPVRRALADIPVLSYDRRGYGASLGAGTGADLGRHVADLIEIMAGRRAVLIGHSFGGIIALCAATVVPSTVLAVGVYEPPQPWRQYWPDPPAWGSAEDAAEVFFAHYVSADAWAALPEDARAARRAEGPALIGDFALDRSSPPYDVTDVLSPMAAAAGSRSPSHFRRGVADLCAEVHQGKRTLIEGASHGAHLSHPDLFAAWVRGVATLGAEAGDTLRP